MTSAHDEGGVIPVVFDLPLRLEIARRHAGYTQGELAVELGVAPNTINRYERGVVTPKKSVVWTWSLATGVNRHWLVTGEAPSPDGDGDGTPVVRHQGLEPRTR